MPSITVRTTPAQSLAIEDLLRRKRQTSKSASALIRRLLDEHLAQHIFPPGLTVALRDETIKERANCQFGVRQQKLFKGGGYDPE